MSEENWVDALGWEEHYQVSDLGRVRSKPSRIFPARHPGKIMKPSRHSKGLGHLTITLQREGRLFKTMISRLVLASFSKLNPKDKQAAHKNGNAEDNRLANLYWASQSENEADKELHGRTYRGARNHNAKLNPDKVREARRRYASGEKISAIAKRFGIAHYSMDRAIKGLTWKHVLESATESKGEKAPPESL